MYSKVGAVALSGLVALASAQFPPTPEGLTILKSKFNENVTISFKEPGICETTPGVKSYSGYVHLPPGFLDNETQNYPINTFFWFFEARKDPVNAPLAIWINGGPGGSSLMGLLEENGPCFIASDSESTYLNPFSWNNEVNMLYIDEPAQVGFSYDVPTNGTMRHIYDPVSERVATEIVPQDFTDGVPESNITHRVGTFGSQNPSSTAGSTRQAAHAIWHFAQTWFFEFPHYKPADNRISLWAESYGGHYGPGFFGFFQEQNQKIADGSSEEAEAHYLHLDTLGIVNGLMDMTLQGLDYIQFPYNNTYGIQVFSDAVYEALMNNFTKPGGCRDQFRTCEAALKERDSLGRSDKNLTEICGLPSEECADSVTRFYLQLGHGWYDIAHDSHDPFPAPNMHGYLTQSSVLAALGVPVNFTSAARAVSHAFDSTYDILHGGFLDSIAALLEAGVKVHMMYGDRDYACNWAGGERASLAVPWSRQAEFAAAGYAPLLTPEAGVKGLTRQLGNLSFTRVFQAGHEVPSYQPEAAYEIFRRATFDLDIATGLLPVTDDLVTVGPTDSWHIKNVVPEMPEPSCYVLKPEICQPEVWVEIVSGKAVVKDFYYVGPAESGAVEDRLTEDL